MIREYKTIQEISGPLMVVDHVQGVTYDELGEIELTDAPSGAARCWRSTATPRWCSCSSPPRASTWRTPRSASWAIRCSWACPPICWDGCSTAWAGPSTAGRRPGGGVPGHQRPAHEPAARDYPNEFIQTGISTIDGLNTLVRGQKLPIFSGSGLPHAALAAQIARQAKVLDGESNFAVVFAAIGITFEESEFFVSEFKRTGAIDRTVLFTNLANDPAVERIATPRMALTAAEYLAFDCGMHVLVILTDITNYAEALREISAAKKEVPRPPRLSRLPLHRPCDDVRARGPSGGQGRLDHDDPHPDDARRRQDPPHPRPDRLYHRGQIILSRELYRRGINPPVDVLPAFPDSRTRASARARRARTIPAR